MASPLEDKTKRVTFFGAVKVIYIVPINKLLRTDLFYDSDDYQRFELDAYYDFMERDQLERQLAEQARQINLRKQHERDLSCYGIIAPDGWLSRKANLVTSDFFIPPENGPPVIAA
jgi:hypothetical protein